MGAHSIVHTTRTLHVLPRPAYRVAALAKKDLPTLLWWKCYGVVSYLMGARRALNGTKNKILVDR